MKTTIEEDAYNTLKSLSPALVGNLYVLLDAGHSPNQIAKSLEKQDVFLAALAEMACVYIQSKNGKVSL